MHTIRISDVGPRGIYPEGVLALDLGDILAECSTYTGRNWVVWRVYWEGQASCREDSGLSFDACYNTLSCEIIDDTPVTISMEDLKRCASCVHQTESGCFFALRPNVTSVSNLRTVQDLENASDLVIQAFDFMFWEVTTEDEELIARLQSKFTRTSLHETMMEGGGGLPTK